MVFQELLLMRLLTTLWLRAQSHASKTGPKNAAFKKLS